MSTDNEKAVAFYHKIGLHVTRKYLSGEKQVEFACFETKTEPTPSTTTKESKETDRLSNDSTIGSIEENIQ